MILNLTNQKFGKLTAIYSITERKHGSIVWVCRCNCGNLKEVRSDSLVVGHTKSCGCFAREQQKKRVAESNFKHGDAVRENKARLYMTWQDMKARYLNPNNEDYKNYGGRGITVCDEWLNSYQAFKKWALANGYTDNLTVDRIDNDGNYEPSNCRWITKSENSKRKKRKKRRRLNDER